MAHGNVDLISIDMIGFQITINNNVIIQVASRSNHLFFFEIQGKIVLIISGIDDHERKLAWPDHILKKGDILKVRVMDLKNVLEPHIDKDLDIPYLKEKYEHLKIELSKKGLI